MLLLAACAAALATTACHEDVARLGGGGFDDARARWQAQRPAMYTMRVEGKIGGSGASIGVTVEDGRATYQFEPQRFNGDFTVDGLFAAIAAAKERGALADAVFDPRYGYPLAFHITGDGPDWDLRVFHFREVRRPTGCDATPGSATDLRAESRDDLGFEEFYNARFTDAAGCPVRLDVIKGYPGAEHCQWESAHFIALGLDVYVHDSHGVLPDADTVDRTQTIATADLPGTARDTGFRTGGAAFWIGPAAEGRGYLVSGERARVYVLDAANAIGCA
jgi:Family of unknown function (DUF6174)